MRLAFDRLVHSDWSVSPKKRWTATALRSSKGWSITHLRQTPGDLVDQLFDGSSHTLAGFDFPIGLPAVCARRAGIRFRDLICDPSSNSSQRFLTPVKTLFDVSIAQPFYRQHPAGGRQSVLLERLGCRSIDDLLRECDKRTANRLRAEAIFWTVGARQVGKAALSGWREILIPALARGARLWPFDGPLSSLVASTVSIAETYPGEAYSHIGMTRMIKKRTQAGRKTAGIRMLGWASEHGVTFVKTIRTDIQCGFGAREDGEDPFDALAGLCGMIEVADGRRSEAPPGHALSASEEGWILGQVDLPVPSPSRERDATAVPPCDPAIEQVARAT
jgi:Protein of unknown function (DUF429)